MTGNRSLSAADADHWRSHGASASSRTRADILMSAAAEPTSVPSPNIAGQTKVEAVYPRRQTSYVGCHPATNGADFRVSRM